MNNIHQQEVEQLQSLFKTEGIDRTAERINILEVFLATEEHVTDIELIALLKERGYHCEPSFVKDTLQFFTQYGFAQENKFEGGQPRYEHRHLGHHHDHIICTRCQKIIEFENEQLEALQLQIASQHGFHMLQHKMEIYGLCPDCINTGKTLVSLASTNEGEHVQIKAFSGGKEMQTRLAAIGLRSGDEVEVITNSGYGPLVLALNCKRLALGRGIAQKIMIIPNRRRKGERPEVRLSQLKEGQKATLVRVTGSGAFRRRLMEMGFLQGTEITVEKYAPLQDPMELIVKGYHVSLRVCEAAQLFVSVEDKR
jgi:Fur family ferric uptake transcriptional regulator